MFIKYAENDVDKMLEFSCDNVFAQCCGRVSTDYWYPIGTKCAPLLADLFIHS